MRGKWPWILLALSLAFNVFFAGGVLYSQITGHRIGDNPDHRLAEVSERLSLTSAQTDELVAMREDMRSSHKKIRELRQERRKQFLKLMAQPTLDKAAMAALMEEGAGQRQAVILSMADRMHGFLWSLSEEQRSGFLEMAQERHFFRRLFGKGRRDGRDSD